MNTITNSNYQTSFGMKQGLKTADIIQRKAKSVYPHILPSRFEHFNDSTNPCLNRFNKYYGKSNLIYNMLITMKQIMLRLKFNESPHNAIINSLKNRKLGNSYEEAMLASTIGRINGQKNIYSAIIDGLKHSVCFITDKAVQDGKSLVLKDKEAIIIDPQLGITDYADNYYKKLKEIFYPNTLVIQSKLDDIYQGKNSKNLKNLKTSIDEIIRQLNRENSRNTIFDARGKLFVTPNENQLKDEKVIEYLKNNYPELIIKDYKKVQV